jgi:hypothetical protein
MRHGPVATVVSIKVSIHLEVWDEMRGVLGKLTQPTTATRMPWISDSSMLSESDLRWTMCEIQSINEGTVQTEIETGEERKRPG